MENTRKHSLLEPIARLHGTPIEWAHSDGELTSAQDSQGSQAPTALSDDDSATIVSEVAEFLKRFIFLRGFRLYQLLALWVIATHLYQDFEHMGYLFVHSPEPQSGKSRVLEVLQLLVKNGSGILISPTEAVLFRTAREGTQLLDEVDSWNNKEHLRSVLNAGFKKGGVVVRNEGGAQGGYRPVRHLVYAPRVLAGVGRGILDATTKDRTFSIAIVRQTKAERRERLRTQKVQPEADRLKKKIEEWVAAQRESVLRRYEAGDFKYLEDFRDRTIDIAEPLAAVLETAYSQRADLEQSRCELCEAIGETREEQDTSSDQGIFHELLRLSHVEDPLIGNASELAERCELPEKPGEHIVSQLLRRYGFKPKSVRKDGTPKYRYVLPAKDLEEIVSRYGSLTYEDSEPETSEEDVVPASQAGTVEAAS